MRVSEERSDVKSQVERIFELAFGRLPDQEERERLVSYATEMRSYHAQEEAAPVSYPTTIERSLVEEFTGEPFDYEEILPVFEDYVPDAKASDVSAEVRALADVCLLVFNANEFMYLY
ncbi:MAG: hypothetical protein AAGJ31_04715, partial [Verrucomicrobiota bacterium]